MKIEEVDCEHTYNFALGIPLPLVRCLAVNDHTFIIIQLHVLYRFIVTKTGGGGGMWGLVV